ncbi:MAG: SulP family inorganic anion transporter [Leptolyngbyaceae bacterium]|nr:SulP family inorganic anion transporter [Leptolyngbyaceae bacterium]
MLNSVAMTRIFLLTQLLKRLRSRSLLPNIIAGFSTGLMIVVSSVSCAVLVFSGDLEPYLPAGIGSALVSAILVAGFVAVNSSFRFAIACPDPAPSAILAIMAATIASQLKPLGSASTTFATVWVSLTLSAICVGIFLFTLGHFRLGRWIRFLPYPVIGGFLAGTGWLLAQGAFTVMAGIPLSFAQLPYLFQADTLWRWLPGVLFGVLLLAVLNRYHHFWVLPSLLLAAIVLSHGVLGLTGIPLSEASLQGWFLAPIPNRSGQFWSLTLLGQVNWSVLLGQVGNLIAMTGVVAINVLLDATGTEIAAQQDADLDQELQANGTANLMAGLCGGMIGHFIMSFSLLNQKAGARSRLAGMTAALLCGFVLWQGGGLLIYLPKAVLGGLLLYLGLELLFEWVYVAWSKLSRLDYALVIIILVMIAVVDFLAGIGMGLLIACLLFVFNYSRFNVIKHVISGAEQSSSFSRSFKEQKLLQEKGHQILILCLQAYIFFGTANTLLEYVRQRIEGVDRPPIRFLILDFRLVSSLDSSAAFSFVKIKQLTAKHGVTLVFSHLSAPIQQKLMEGGCLDPQDKQSQVFSDLDHSIEWCENKILQKEGSTCDLLLPLAQQLQDLFLSEEQVPRFISYLEPLEAPADYCVFRQGELPEILYFIESGQVTIWLELPSGKKARLRTMGSGTIIGEMGLYTGEPRSASVITDQPSQLYGLSAQALQTMQTESPELANAFQKFVICTLSERLAHREKKLQALLL